METTSRSASGTCLANRPYRHIRGAANVDQEQETIQKFIILFRVHSLMFRCSSSEKYVVRDDI